MSEAPKSDDGASSVGKPRTSRTQAWDEYVVSEARDIQRGRGTSGNPANRFERLHLELDPTDPAEAEERPGLRTQFFRDGTKTIISRNNSPDVGFDRSINPYRGCEHGCAYCFARPTHEYLGFSAGLDFESKIMVKENAAALLETELASPKWEPQVVVMSGVTDPYQPAERRFRITRGCLEVLAKFRNPVGIITKNRLVTRDIDVLRELAKHDAVTVNISITSLDRNLQRILEPRTSPPQARLDAIAELNAAGVPAGVMIGPVIPGLTDHEMPAILEAAGKAGAQFAGHVVLRLPWAVKPLFERWLDEHFPDRKEKVLGRLKHMHGGDKVYDSSWGKRQTGEGVFAEQIASMFEVACRRAGIQGRRRLSIDAFRRFTPQLELF